MLVSSSTSLTVFAICLGLAQGRPNRPHRLLENRSDYPEFRSLGCFTDSTSNRVLRGPGLHSDDMTPAKCNQWCSDQEYEYSGIEFGRECYCDWTFARPQFSQSCNMPCVGSDANGATCGGAGAIEIFASLDNSYASPTPVWNINELLEGWNYVGCFTDNRSGRTLERLTSLSEAITIESCLKACQKQGFSYAGTEYGSECCEPPSFLRKQTPRRLNDTVCRLWQRPRR
jgi:hypothetical protein